jgi:glyoxylase-like metal-dependent hydrolase (beta-lactamase superfamily II)
MSDRFDFADEQNWFVVGEPVNGVFAIRAPLHGEDVRSYLVVGSERALLIDTGMGVGDIRRIVKSITDLPLIVVNSHSHWDHVGGNWRFSDIAIHAAEAANLGDPTLTEKLQRACAPEHLKGPLPPGVTPDSLSIPATSPTTLVYGGERFELGNRTFEVLHLPGHAPGLLAFFDRRSGTLISTDVVYPGPLYAQSDDCDLDAYLASLDRLVELLPVVVDVLPSHSGDTMPPAMIQDMRDAMAEVMAGRTPEVVDFDKATHQFDGFGIYVKPDYRGISEA